MSYIAGIKGKSPSTYETRPPGSGGGGGLVATYSSDNGSTDMPVGTSTAVLATISGVIVAAGQSVIVHATTFYSVTAGTGPGSYIAGVKSNIGGPLVPIDLVEATSIVSETDVITRVFEIKIPTPGTYTFELVGQVTGALTAALVTGDVTNVSPGARLTVEVVSV